MTRSRLVDDTPYLASTTPTERTVVAELYHQARVAGLQPTLEVSFEMPERLRTYSDSPRVFRADLGIVHNSHIVALVEAKPTKPKIPPKTASVVGEAALYHAIGLPWRYCLGMDEIPEVVAWLTDIR